MLVSYTSLPTEIQNLILDATRDNAGPIARLSLVSRQLFQELSENVFYIPQNSNCRTEQTILAELKQRGNRLESVVASIIGPSRFCSLWLKNRQTLLELFQKTVEQSPLHIPQNSNFETECRIFVDIILNNNPLHNLVARLIGPSAFIKLPKVDLVQPRSEQTPKMTVPIMLSAGSVVVRFIARMEQSPTTVIESEETTTIYSYGTERDQFGVDNPLFSSWLDTPEDLLTRFFTHQPCGQQISMRSRQIEGERTLSDGRSVIELDDK